MVLNIETLIWSRVARSGWSRLKMFDVKMLYDTRAIKTYIFLMSIFKRKIQYFVWYVLLLFVEFSDWLILYLRSCTAVYRSSNSACVFITVVRTAATPYTLSRCPSMSLWYINPVYFLAQSLSSFTSALGSFENAAKKLKLLFLCVNPRHCTEQSRDTVSGVMIYISISMTP